jgi:endoglucanase
MNGEQGKRMIRKLSVSLVMMLLIAQVGLAYLKTLGPYIVDSTGQPILLRGVGLGGWLVPEGYMVHIPGYGSPTDIENKIKDLIGSANTAQFFQLYRANYVSRTDIQLISQWGYNSIRLPFHYKVVYDPDQGAFRADGFALLDSLLAWCEASNLYVILDMHAAPGGQNKENHSDSDGIEARLWTNRANQVLAFKIWKKIAQRYANREIVGGYDLLNEPVLPSGYSNDVLRDFYHELTDSIRTVDKNHIVFIEGNWYATDFRDLTPPFVSNMVYSFHKYWNETSFATITDLVSMRTSYQFPLWMGESGENSNPWFYEAVQLFEQQNIGIGWCWWTHKKIETITSPLSSPVTPDYQVILDYWNGQGSRPSEAFAMAALFGMAENLAVDKCEFHPDVLKALFDPQFGTVSKPFKNHSVPGIVDAVDYDFGTNGVAYWDTDYRNVGDPGGTAYNHGGAYRNDGVDIEKAQDPLGGPYDVGWVDSGEWLNYTVNITAGGEYRVNLRVASPNSTGQIRLFIDNQPATDTLDVPQTGGWQTWTTLKIDSVPLPAGQHLFTVSFSTGGFNINRMEFILTTTDVQEEQGQEPLNFKLMQNYPNPFNPTTTISYELAATRFVSLRIYDTIGREVITLEGGIKPPGIYDVTWNAANEASGAYYYRLQAGEFLETKKLLLIK